MNVRTEQFRAKLLEQKQNNLFCDVVLVAAADNTRISMHRVVIYAASEYFEKLLTTDMKEMNSKEIVLNGVAGIVLEHLIEFCYTQKIKINASNAIDILTAAHLFQFDEVVEICEKFFVDEIDATNALGLHVIADQYSLSILQEAARAFAYNEFLEIIENEEYLRLDVEKVVDFLQSDDIQVHSEEDVYNAIIKWIDGDRDARRLEYAVLMKYLRLSKIDNYFLNGRIQTVSEELNMTQVFEDVCNKANHQVAPDAERKWLPLVANYMLAFGVPLNCSSTTSQLSRYSIAANKWDVIRSIPNMNDPQIHCIHNCLYLISTYHNMTECIPLSTMHLDVKAMSNHKRSFFASVADRQYIYLIGGLGMNSESVERYDTKKDEWAEMAMLNNARYGLSAAVLAGKIYAVGGVDELALQSVERYDPETNQWTEVAPLNVARVNLRCCTVRDSIYAVGGCDESGNYLASIEKYDAQINQWTIIPFQLDIRRSRFGIGVQGDWIYIAGGHIKNSYSGSRTVQRINVFNGKIENLAALNFSAGCLDCVMIP